MPEKPSEIANFIQICGWQGDPVLGPFAPLKANRLWGTRQSSVHPSFLGLETRKAVFADSADDLAHRTIVSNGGKQTAT